jgi:DNA-binding transcriptional ArsR family regulator
VLAALAGGEPMTAGQVAEKAGLGRGTVSTTLSKLAKSGEVEKAERGYRIAAADAANEAPVGKPAEPAGGEATVGEAIVGEATEPPTSGSSEASTAPVAGSM